MLHFKITDCYKSYLVQLYFKDILLQYRDMDYFHNLPGRIMDYLDPPPPPSPHNSWVSQVSHSTQEAHFPTNHEKKTYMVLVLHTSSYNKIAGICVFRSCFTKLVESKGCSTRTDITSTSELTLFCLMHEY